MRLFHWLCLSVACVSPLAAATYTVTVPTGYSLIANHLNRGSNTLAEVLGTVPDGTVFTKWNNSTHSLYSSNTFRALEGGWANSTETFHPGEGAWLENPGAPFTLTFEGTATAPIVPVELVRQFRLLSRQVAGVASFEQITGRRPGDGAIVYRYRTNRWEAYSFWPDTGWIPQAPAIPVGEAVFIACEQCVSIAPRIPETLSFAPQDGSTNHPRTDLVLSLRDPDGQIASGSVAATLNGGTMGPPRLSVPAPGEGIFTWSPLIATGWHRAEFTFEVKAFQAFDYDIPARRVTNATTFVVQISPAILNYMYPPDGSTNHALERLLFSWEDPDYQLDTNSILALLDGVALTNVQITRAGQTVLGFYFPQQPHTDGLHTFELAYSDVSIPPRWTTNRVTFTVALIPIIVLDEFPDMGSTNLNAIHKLGAVWRDLDQLLDTNSFVARLDGFVVTNGSVRRFESTVHALYFPHEPLTAGEHMFEMTFQDLTVPPNVSSHRIFFYTRNAPELHAVRIGNRLSLSWDGPALLEQSSNLSDWSDVGPSSPHVEPMTESRKFFRLREP